MSFSYGDTDISLDSIKDGYWIENKLFLEFGFKTGDKILAVNGTELKSYRDLKKSIISGRNYTDT